MLTPTAAMKLGAYRMASSLTALPNVARVRTLWIFGNATNDSKLSERVVRVLGQVRALAQVTPLVLADL